MQTETVHSSWNFPWHKLPKLSLHLCTCGKSGVAANVCQLSSEGCFFLNIISPSRPNQGTMCCWSGLPRSLDRCTVRWFKFSCLACPGKNRDKVIMRNVWKNVFKLFHLVMNKHCFGAYIYKLGVGRRKKEVTQLQRVQGFATLCSIDWLCSVWKKNIFLYFFVFAFTEELFLVSLLNCHLNKDKASSFYHLLKKNVIFILMQTKVSGMVS